MVRVSDMGIDQESFATVVLTAGNSTQAIFVQKPHYGMFSPLKVHLCHSVMRFTTIVSGVLLDHLHSGHLWADLLKRTVANESRTLEVSHLPTASRSW